MKNPLHYQLSGYDCGPTTMLNAISFLFEREEISPVLIRNVMLYCLDCYNEEGIMGKRGTSTAAMMFLCNWLNGFGKIGHLPISGTYLSGERVWIGEDSLIWDALCRGGAVVVRLYYECPHYVLLTGIKDRKILMFDPYYEEEVMEESGVISVKDQPFSHNKIVDQRCLNRETMELYALGPVDGREAVILFNENTRQTPEKTIEYFI